MPPDGTIVRECRRLLPDYAALYLFGSAARGATHAGSDLDLAVLGRRPCSAREKFDLAQELSLALGEEVDLVDLLRAPTVLQVEVIEAGRLLDDREPTTRRLFEVRVLSAFALLNEERAEILADTRRRGRIHAR